MCPSHSPNLSKDHNSTRTWHAISTCASVTHQTSHLITLVHIPYMPYLHVSQSLTKPLIWSQKYKYLSCHIYLCPRYSPNLLHDHTSTHTLHAISFSAPVTHQPSQMITKVHIPYMPYLPVPKSLTNPLISSHKYTYLTCHIYLCPVTHQTSHLITQVHMPHMPYLPMPQ